MLDQRCGQPGCWEKILKSMHAHTNIPPALAAMRTAVASVAEFDRMQLVPCFDSMPFVLGSC